MVYSVWFFKPLFGSSWVAKIENDSTPRFSCFSQWNIILVRLSRHRSKHAKTVSDKTKRKPKKKQWTSSSEPGISSMHQEGSIGIISNPVLSLDAYKCYISYCMYFSKQINCGVNICEDCHHFVFHGSGRLQFIFCQEHSWSFNLPIYI